MKLEMIYYTLSFTWNCGSLKFLVSFRAICPATTFVFIWLLIFHMLSSLSLQWLQFITGAC